MSQDYEMIEAFLENRLSPDEQLSFERRMKAEEALAKAVRRHRAAHLLLEYSAVEQTLKRIADESPGKIKAPTKRIYARGAIRTKQLLSYRLFAIAAVVSGLLVLAGVFLYGNWHYADKTLAVAHFIPYETNQIRGEREMKMGMQLYTERNFDEAARHLAGVETHDPGYIEAQFFLANAYFQIERFDSAELAFRIASQAGDARYSKPAQWYLPLSLLAQGDTGKARQVLETITADPQHRYAAKAQELLNKMNSPWRKLAK